MLLLSLLGLSLVQLTSGGEVETGAAPTEAGLNSGLPSAKSAEPKTVLGNGGEGGLILPCSEALCGPRVSKCMLLKSCNCSMTAAEIRSGECECCKDCVRCLGPHYPDCCSCVGLCKPQKIPPGLAMRSYVEELSPDSEERALFSLVLASVSHEDAPHTVHSFPALEGPPDAPASPSPALGQAADGHWATATCTVLYVKHCLSNERCRSYCATTGASSLRWFHTGCCECVGQDCLNYGDRIDRCLHCKDDLHHEHRTEL